jgi:hypothetical protein
MKTIKKIGQLSVAMMAIILVVSSCKKAPSGVVISTSTPTIAMGETATIEVEVDGKYSWLQWYTQYPGESTPSDNVGGVSASSFIINSASTDIYGPGEYVVYLEARNCRPAKASTEDCNIKTKSNEIVITVTP